ncbi:Flocculation suppression protein [Vermiconidia calcicola]|uniref:Flocculation suppression protein n=1 Tax=Vermiconidia calcicola TaxID=1690605 RepID=A0ACC3N574_9PEZI|nr:Flocculation suppression protein [Vermiconidia calcicola]
MASVGEPLSRSPFHGGSQGFNHHLAKSIPILPSSAASSMSSGDPMDMSHAHPQSMGPPMSSPNVDRTNEQQPHHQNEQQHRTTNGGSHHPVGAAAAAQQPKVVQTAFIHKLYNMLEDQTIQHLISWSQTNESFVMSPSSEFSKVLAQYFKHTNISSFVRQLNMYGFHKVSDVFHTGSPDSPLWEFKHGAGNFKRGDLVGLREIKRRASRHALIHRDSFSSAPKLPTVPQPGMPLEPPTVQDPVEGRFGMLEWQMQDIYNRMARAEDAHAAVTSKCQALLDGLAKSHQWNQELSSHLLTLVPDPDNPVHRDVYAMRQDILRHMDQLRTIEEPQEPLFANKQSYFHNNNLTVDSAMSPRQRPFDESRRPSLQAIGPPRPIRAPAAPHLQVSPRRYGSIGTANGAYSPSSTRPNYPPPPPPPTQPPQHPLATASSPPANLARRHTSADIRVHGWGGHQPSSQYNHGSSPYASGHSSAAWPSSPRQSGNPGDQQLRDALAQYELPRAANIGGSRHPSPPPPHETGPPSFTSSFGGTYAGTNEPGWQVPGARYPFKGLDTGPPTRRSSMASNVHSLLNPADTAEREGEDEGIDDLRKRKRLL